MSLKKINFQIAKIEFSNKETLIIDGRLCEGSIKVGSTFNTLEVYHFDDNNEKQIIHQFNVLLKVLEISAYGRSLPEIDEGLTARLEMNFLKPSKDELEKYVKTNYLVSILGSWSPGNS